LEINNSNGNYSSNKLVQPTRTKAKIKAKTKPKTKKLNIFNKNKSVNGINTTSILMDLSSNNESTINLENDSSQSFKGLVNQEERENSL